MGLGLTVRVTVRLGLGLTVHYRGTDGLIIFASRGVRVHPRKDLSPEGIEMSLEVGKIRSSQICFCCGDLRTVRAVLAVQKSPKSTDGIVPSGSQGSKSSTEDAKVTPNPSEIIELNQSHRF